MNPLKKKGISNIKTKTTTSLRQTAIKTTSVLKKRVKKSASADTLVAHKPPAATAGFLVFLASNAIIIQRWYRNIIAKRIQQNQENTVQDITNTTDIPKDDLETIKMKRRRELAEQVRQEILEEMQQCIKINSESKPVELRFESKIHSSETKVKELDEIGDAISAVNMYYSKPQETKLYECQKDLPNVHFKESYYADEFDTFDPDELSSLIDNIEDKVDAPKDIQSPTAVKIGTNIVTLDDQIPKQVLYPEKKWKPISIEYTKFDSDEISGSSETIIIAQQLTDEPPLELNKIQHKSNDKNNPGLHNRIRNSKILESRKQCSELLEKNKEDLVSDHSYEVAISDVDKTEDQTPKMVRNSKKVKEVIKTQKFPPTDNIGIHLGPSLIPHEKVDDNDENASDSINRILTLLKSVDTPTEIIPKIDFESIQPERTAFDGIKQKLLQQQLDLESGNKNIEALRNQLKLQKSQSKEDLEELQKKTKSQLGLQRKEYETIVTRHLSFIDKIIAEKEDLSQKSILLTNQVAELEKQYKTKIQNCVDGHTRDIKQQREMWQAAEKIKRDKWIQEKTKIIKDQTVQGLEPEIQKLISQHKVQLRHCEERSSDALAKEKQNLLDQHSRQLEALSSKHVTDRQRACEEEREFARQRYIKQLERDEMEFQQQKRKLQVENDEQRHRLSESHTENLISIENTHKRQLNDLRRQLETEQQTRDRTIESQNHKHIQDTNNLRTKLQTEKEEWQSNYMKKIEAQIRVQQKSFREQLIKERDSEIEMVIQRLESESGSNNSDATRRYRIDLERVKSEAAQEMKILRDQHSLALDKIMALQNEMKTIQKDDREVQKKLLNMECVLESKDNLIKKQKGELDRLKVDESSFRDELKVEFQEEISTKAQTIKSLEDEIFELNSRVIKEKEHFKDELKNALNDKERTMNSLEQRVMKALQNKDKSIKELQNRLEESNIRANHFEKAIEKQRAEILEAL